MKIYILGNLLSLIHSVSCTSVFDMEKVNPNSNAILIQGYGIKNFIIKNPRYKKHLTKVIIKNTSLEDFPVGLNDICNIRELDLINNIYFKNWEILSLFPNLESLTIIDQGLKIIPPEIFKMKKLQILMLDKNLIENIPEEIKNLKNLKIISLNFNLLSELPEKFFTIKKLHTISLNGNKLENISKNISNLKNLNILNLQGNRFSNFPKEIFNSKSLMDLDLSSNEIKEIPKEIGRLKNLKNINLSKNQITSFPVSLLEIIELDIINLSSNKINELPKKFRRSKFLNCFDLSGNQLTYFPEKFFYKIGVLHLNLSNNRIKYKKEIKPLNFFSRCFPRFFLKSIDSLKGFTTRNFYSNLNLSNNELDEIPDFIFNLGSLKALDLSKNSFKSLVYDFKELEYLRTLNLSENKLEKLSNSPYFFRLADLNLSKNKFRDIPLGILDMKNIKNLNLSYNEITEFPRLETRKKLYRLSNVNLKFNKLQSLENNFFPHVKTLNLSNNCFKTFPSKILNLKFLQFINLKHNEISELNEKDYELLKAKNTPGNISWNFIKFKSENGNDKEFIEKIKKDNLINHQPQLDRKITISEVFENHKKELLHWNIEKLNEIKLEQNIEEQAKNISDKTMQRMWRDVLKFFIADNENENNMIDEIEVDKEDEINAESTIEIGEDITKTLNDKSINKLIENCKIKNTDFKTRFKLAYFSQSKREIITNYLRRISEGSSQEKNIIKSYIKILFVKLLEVVEANIDEDIKTMIANLTNLCTNSLNKCETGQTEGLKYYYSVYCKKNVEIESIESLLRQKIAAIKEEVFISCCLFDPTENVHLVNVFRQIFENILGISNEFRDPYNFITVEEYEGKAGNILEVFFNKFSIENVMKNILEEIKKNQKYTNLAFDYLSNLKKNEKLKLRSKKTLSDDEIYKIYQKTSKNYFNYIKVEDEDGTSNFYYDKLNRKGLLKILRNMNLVENE